MASPLPSQPYPIPKGLHETPKHLLDLRPDSDIDHDILHPPPVTNEKNLWFFWATGYTTMHPYAQRTIRTYYRRFAPQGWSLYVLNLQPSSPLYVGNSLSTTDPGTFPRSFREGTMNGTYAVQHQSDLVRWPLLLKCGGIYADVGLMPIGNIDALWEKTVGKEGGRWEVLSYNIGGTGGRGLTNYFLASLPGNQFFYRCHRLLLHLWDEGGGKTSTAGMRESKLLAGVPLQGGDELGEETRGELTDYIIQGQVMSAVMGLVDEEGGWDGPKYVAEHVYAMEYMVGSQLINEITGWDGRRAWELLCLKMPGEGEGESEEQGVARGIVERCLTESFAFKLAHGLILKVLGETVGSLWRKYEGSDCVEGTYAGWLRYGMVYWGQEGVPARLEFEIIEPFRRGRLLGEN